jgi:hemoglobin
LRHFSPSVNNTGGVSGEVTNDEPMGDEIPIGRRMTVFEAVGGQVFFDALAAAFYRRVGTDQVLLRLYPEQDDLAPAARRLALFLGQYWGGPTTYSDERGHPRLRMRHFPFTIGPLERDHWMDAMNGALDELQVHPLVRDKFDAYFASTAEAMRNQD